MIRVYVIQLWRPYLTRRYRPLPWVYVGSSAHEPEHRLEQHRGGGLLASKRLKGAFFWRLRPELYEDLPPFAERTDAELAEQERARRLGDAGFTAWCDGQEYSVGTGDPSPFDAADLRSVAERFAGHVDSIRRHAVRPLTVEEVVSILRWDPTHSVSALVRTPSDDAGRFTHVQAKAVERMASVCLKRSDNAT